MPVIGAIRNMASQHRLSAPSPNRSISPETRSPTDQPMAMRLKKKADKAIPRSNTQTPKNGRAKKAAGVTLIIVRTKLMIIRAPIISVGRSGLINNCPRLRAHISSTNVSDRPRFERNRTSHNNTALMSAPAAWANQELCCKKNVVINPHSKSWKVGQ